MLIITDYPGDKFHETIPKRIMLTFDKSNVLFSKMLAEAYLGTFQTSMMEFFYHS